MTLQEHSQDHREIYMRRPQTQKGNEIPTKLRNFGAETEERMCGGIVKLH